MKLSWSLKKRSPSVPGSNSTDAGWLRRGATPPTLSSSLQPGGIDTAALTQSTSHSSPSLLHGSAYEENNEEQKVVLLERRTENPLYQVPIRTRKRSPRNRRSQKASAAAHASLPLSSAGPRGLGLLSVSSPPLQSSPLSLSTSQSQLSISSPAAPVLSSSPLHSASSPSPSSSSSSSPSTASPLSFSDSPPSPKETPHSEISTQNPLFGHQELHSRLRQRRPGSALARSCDTIPEQVHKANPLFGDTRARDIISKQRDRKIEEVKSLEPFNFRRTRRDSLCSFQLPPGQAGILALPPGVAILGAPFPASSSSSASTSPLSSSSGSRPLVDAVQKTSNPLFGKTNPVLHRGVVPGVLDGLQSGLPTGSEHSESDDSVLAMSDRSDADASYSSVSGGIAIPLHTLQQLRMTSIDDADTVAKHLMQLSTIDKEQGNAITTPVIELAQQASRIALCFLDIGRKSEDILLTVLDVLENYSTSAPALFIARWTASEGLATLLSLALANTSDEIFSRSVSMICHLCFASTTALARLASDGGEYAIFQAAASDMTSQEPALRLLVKMLQTPALRPVVTKSKYIDALVDFLAFQEIRCIYPEVTVADISIPRALPRRSAESPAMYGHTPVSMHSLEAGSPDFFHLSADLMSVIVHPNILPVIAACSQPPVGQPSFIISPYFRFGVLSNLLFSTKPSAVSSGSLAAHAGQEFAAVPARAAVIDWNSLVCIAEGLASGLMWLHSHAIHPPLNPDRVVIADDYTPKLILTFEISGSPRYLAPELIQQELAQADVEITEKSNVYSYAILIWELLTSTKAYRRVTPAQIASDPLVRPSMPPNLPQSIVHILTSCWHPSPDERPKFAQLAAQWQRFKMWLERSGQTLPALPLATRTIKRSISSGRPNAVEKTEKRRVGQFQDV